MHCGQTIHPTVRLNKWIGSAPYKHDLSTFNHLDWPRAIKFPTFKISASYLFNVLMTWTWLSGVDIVEWKPNKWISYTTRSAISTAGLLVTITTVVIKVKGHDSYILQLQGKLNSSDLQFAVAYWPTLAVGGTAQLAARQTHLCPSQAHYGLYPAMFSGDDSTKNCIGR